LLQFQMPNITREQLAGNRARFEVEPLDRGFGHTFGNALRRVLLSSLEGAAVSSVKIEGVAHEFTTVKGVKEDVTDVILNLKELVCRLHGELDEVQVRLYKDKPGKVVAADIDIPAELEILNPDHHIATLSDGGAIEMMLTIRRGAGYVAAEGNKTPETVIGVIPIDSIFSPIKRVSYHVESARVGQRTDYDKLILDITTNGALMPEEALRQAADGPLKGILAISDVELVSIDFKGNPHSSIIDSAYTKVMDGDFVKVLSWYDNEWGYSNRCVDLLMKLVARGL